MENQYEDNMLRAIASEMGIRVMFVTTNEIVTEGAARHQTTPETTKVLGEAMTGAVMLGMLLKLGQRVAIKFEGESKLGKIIVESNNDGEVRGYVAAPRTELTGAEANDMLALFGTQGHMRVVKDLRLPKLYESLVPLVEGSTGNNLTHYLRQSEQIDSYVTAGVHVDENNNVLAAGGLLLQVIPGAKYQPGSLEMLEARLQEMPPIEDMLLEGKTAENILADLFQEDYYKILAVRPITFECSCSQERSQEAILALGREEIMNILATEGQAEVDCHFCHKQYVVDQDTLEQMLFTLI